jgi:hypothetical protein
LNRQFKRRLNIIGRVIPRSRLMVFNRSLIPRSPVAEAALIRVGVAAQTPRSDDFSRYAA